MPLLVCKASLLLSIRYSRQITGLGFSLHVGVGCRCLAELAELEAGLSGECHDNALGVLVVGCVLVPRASLDTAYLW